MVHDGSEPERTRGMWMVPSLWKFSSSMPSAVKQGMSQRMCDPRNSSAEPRNGALGVRRRFCFARMPTAGLLSKIETKLGICWPFHWSWSGRESSESGVALREREPVLQVWWVKTGKVVVSQADVRCRHQACTYLDVTKHIANIWLLPRVSRSRSATNCSIQSLHSQFHRLRVLLRQTRQDRCQLRCGLLATLDERMKRKRSLSFA